ncbi:hypothetical protein GGS21DRAFT_543055 [Xylaria nigripes]|nr:hypothetical protein GGS21DRAFT_543055 [Xylaria nigripes]
MDDLKASAQQRGRCQGGTPSTTSSSAHTPLYYVERPELTHHTASGPINTPGSRVPLIPIDELPEWIEILGIPRQLTDEQILEMSSLGNVPRGKPYEVQIIPSCPQNAFIPNSNMDHKGKHIPGQNTDDRSSEHKIDDIHDSIVNNDRPLTGLHQRPLPPATLDMPPENPYLVLYTKRPYRARGRQSHFKEHPAERLLRASRVLSRRHRRTTVDTLPLSLPCKTPHLPASTPAKTTAETKRSSTAPSQNVSQNNNNNNNVTTTKTSNNTGQKTSHACSSNEQANECGKPIIYCRNWCRRGKCSFNKACRYRHEMPRTDKELREAGLESYPSWWLMQGRLGSRHAGNSQHTRPDVQRIDVTTLRDTPTYPGSKGTGITQGMKSGHQGETMKPNLLQSQSLHPQEQFYHITDSHTSGLISSRASSALPSKEISQRKGKQQAIPLGQKEFCRSDSEAKHNSFSSSPNDGNTPTSDSQHRKINHIKKPTTTVHKENGRGSTNTSPESNTNPQPEGVPLQTQAQVSATDQAQSKQCGAPCNGKFTSNLLIPSQNASQDTGRTSTHQEPRPSHRQNR